MSVRRHADVRLFWHPQGDYLAVQVDRFTKTRKSTYTAFELFSVKERDIPMEARPLRQRTRLRSIACHGSMPSQPDATAGRGKV